MADAATYRSVAEAAWRWVLDQVRWDDGPWIPTSGPTTGGQAAGAASGAATDPATGATAADPGGNERSADQEGGASGPPPDRDGMHSGIGGLAHLLAEVRLGRDWTPEEARLATAVADRLRDVMDAEVDASYFDGLVSHLGSVGVLGRRGGETAAVERLLALGDAEGWQQTAMGPPRYRSEARVNDATLGTAGVLLGAVWAQRREVEGAATLAGHAADVLLREAESEPTGSNWLFVPRRFCLEPVQQLPNWSHGLAGIATSLALAGAELDRPELVVAARSGAEHLVTLGNRGGQGFEVPHVLPRHPDHDEVTYSWCHGPTGTSLLFAALHHAGLPDVAGEAPLSWHRRCLRSVRSSGLPARLRPGFWDNDGRCCGTAGVLEALLDAWQLTGDPADLAFAVRLADALVDRALLDRDRACWRFIEHRTAESLLPPGVGWMQGAAGIAAVLFRVARILDEGRQAPVVDRLDTWWTHQQRR